MNRDLDNVFFLSGLRKKGTSCDPLLVMYSTTAVTGHRGDPVVSMTKHDTSWLF